MEEARVPGFVKVVDPLLRRVMGTGLPLGPNVLLTVRGRVSGQPRTTPVAVVAVDGRRWIIGTFGETNWVRNLRAAGAGTITVDRRPREVRAIELTPPERATFFRDVLAPFVRRIPLGKWLLRSLGASDIVADPDGAALRHPVFELIEI